MQKFFHAPALQATAVLMAIAMHLGCNAREYEVAEVEGVVTLNGQPGGNLRIEFAPDGSKGAKGPSSTAVTDSAGSFTLTLMERGGSEASPGAVVGWHRVVITDPQLSASATGRGVPIRISSDYSLVGTTPLSQEIKPGKQSIEIAIP